jgi:YHS domain-containing protein
MKTIRIILFISIVSLVLMGTSALSPVYAHDPINADSRGVAIDGFDPVAYFTQGKVVEGSEEFSYHWMGAIWHFASSQHLEMFKSNPERYAPQYGGY